GLLVLDVVARNAGLDEPADEVAHVRVAAVTRVGVGDDEGPEVHLGRGLALGRVHPRASEALVLVGRQQGAHEAGGLVGHLAERVAGEVRARVLVARALGRRGPPAEVDALDAGPLHLHRLAGRVRAEARDRLALRELLPQQGVELLGRLTGDGVVLVARPPLLGHLARRVHPRDAGEALARHPLANPLDLVLESPHNAPLVATLIRGLYARSEGSGI